MMGRREGGQGQFFYSFDLDKVVPADHLVRQIDNVLDLDWVHSSASRDPDALPVRHQHENREGDEFYGAEQCAFARRRSDRIAESMSPFGPSRRFAAAQQFSRFRSEADIQRDSPEPDL
jgi:hypothetical protein